MLRQLEIEGFGLIERAEVEFDEGATIFTGETGSGKTMLLGALDFVLGARAGPDVVRRGARRALVTLSFDPEAEVRARLEQDGFEIDPGETATISREMTESGRSTLRVNGRASAAAYVRDLRNSIAEMIGQHEAQRLLAPSYHLELLDRFAGNDALALRQAVARAYARAEGAAEALAHLTQNERTARERYDEASFTVCEIDEARLESGEPERLAERRGYLDNVERIALALRAAHDALAGEDRGATASLGAATAALAGVAKFDGTLREMIERAGALQSDAVDLAAELARAHEAAEYDPNELEGINARLALVERLQRKYGGSVDDVLAASERARAIVDEFEGRDRNAVRLEAEALAARNELERQAAALNALRKKAASRLAKRVVAEFGELALGAGRFEVSIEPLERIGPNGSERVEFLFAANAGEPARALSRVASGGELSRVLLALVVILAGVRGSDAALVFDEIDAGIGGATATAVGARIGALGQSGQVVCVTHLAQLATWADRHYVLEKIETKSETSIVARPIKTAKEREGEIARMLSGESHDVALRHARKLLARGS
jgi:DNA repair protein RecN (Recombination protein N)